MSITTNGQVFDVGYDQIVLEREGFQSLTIRNKNGYWQLLEYTDHYGAERWSKPIDETIFDVEDHIKLYAKRKDTQQRQTSQETQRPALRRARESV